MKPLPWTTRSAPAVTTLPVVEELGKAEMVPAELGAEVMPGGGADETVEETRVDDSGQMVVVRVTMMGPLVGQFVTSGGHEVYVFV